MSRYDRIINLSRPTSAYPKMSPLQRAAQFSAFAALVGLDEQMDETARRVDSKIELSEDEVEILNRKLSLLAQKLDESEEYPQIELTYFVPDERKNGGAYVTKTVAVRSIDTIFHKIILSDKSEINIADILDLKRL